MLTSFVTPTRDQRAIRTTHLNIMRLQKCVSRAWIKDDGTVDICFCISLQPPMANVNHPKTVLTRRGYQAIIINETPLTGSGWTTASEYI